MRIDSTARWLAAASLMRIAAGEVVPQNTVVKFMDGPDGFQSDDSSPAVLKKGPVFSISDRLPRPKYFLFTTSVDIAEVVLFANGAQVGLAKNTAALTPLPGPNGNDTSSTTTTPTGPPLPSGTDSTTVTGNAASSTLLNGSPSRMHGKHGQRDQQQGSSTGASGTGSSPAISFNLTIRAAADGTRIGNISFLDLGQFRDQKITDQEMYFQAFWTETGGISYSRPWTVTESAVGSNNFTTLEEMDMYTNDTPFLQEVNPSASVTTISGAVPTVTGNPSASGSASGGVSVNAGSSGLSTGAIAGIAVGCGLAAVILAGLGLFFCMRRRRDHSGAAAPFSGSNRTQELIGEKEANGGADLSPHSPYSDDGHQAALRDHMDDLDGHSHGSAVPMTSVAAGGGGAAAAAAVAGGTAAGLGGHHDAAGARSYTPYSDHPSSHRGAGLSSRQSAHLDDSATHSSYTAAGGSPRAGTATPQGVSAQYAHLIEDDMTAEQIAALEEEERQLDAAIERAGGPGSAPRRR